LRHLSLGRTNPGLIWLAHDPGHGDGRENAENDDDDHEFDQRESALPKPVSERFTLPAKPPLHLKKSDKEPGL
jgi:hypothetical protein